MEEIVLLKDDEFDLPFSHAVREMTSNAMGGSVTFRKALQDRLNLIRPSQSQIKDFQANNPPSLSPRIQVDSIDRELSEFALCNFNDISKLHPELFVYSQDLVSLLHCKGIPVFLISGGFHEFIDPVADTITINRDRVFANRFSNLYGGKVIRLHYNCVAIDSNPEIAKY